MSLIENADESLPLEEWKLCQSVIAQLEGWILRRQSWFFALVTALVVASIKPDPFLTKMQFTVLGFSAVAVFYVAEIIQRVPHHRAIQRARHVEACIRGEGQYDGPLMSISLSQGNGWRDFFAFFYKIRVWAPYAAVLAVVVLVRMYAL